MLTGAGEPGSVDTASAGSAGIARRAAWFTTGMRVDIWSDIVCPWCYIGKREFEQGLAGFAHRDEIEVTYHAFELDPSAPAGTGGKVIDMLAAKYGLGPEQAAQAEAGVAARAAAAGLAYAPGRRTGRLRRDFTQSI